MLFKQPEMLPQPSEFPKLGDPLAVFDTNGILMAVVIIDGGHFTEDREWLTTGQVVSFMLLTDDEEAPEWIAFTNDQMQAVEWHYPGQWHLHEDGVDLLDDLDIDADDIFGPSPYGNLPPKDR